MMGFFMAGGGDAASDAIPNPDWVCQDVLGLVALDFDPLLVYSQTNSRVEIGRALGVAVAPTETLYSSVQTIAGGIPVYDLDVTAYMAEQYTWFIRLADLGGVTGLYTEWETFPVVDPGCGEPAGGGGGGGGGGLDGGTALE